MPLEELKSLLERSKPKALGISIALESQLKFVKQACKFAKSKNIKCFLGGPLYQRPENIKKYSVECASGYSEKELLEFLLEGSTKTRVA